MILRTDPPGSGDWAVIAVGETVLALPDCDRVDDMVSRLAGADGFRAALERLVSDGISAAPDFALVDAGGGVVRLVLRGPAELTAGAERISGAGVTTWTERVLESAGELRLVVPGSSWTVVLEGAAAPARPPEDPPPVREDAAPHATLAPPPDDTLRSTEPLGNEMPAPGGTGAGAEPYAFLFGDTVYRTVSGADVRIPNPDPARPGDHDGRTVLVDDPESREQQGAPRGAGARGPGLALEFPDGAVEPLTAPLLVGRSPIDPGHDASGGPPRLVRIAADDKDISRTHARIEVAGGAVVVTDLDSRNGTSVTMPGSAPRRLRAGEPSVVLPDTLIDLGGGVTMTVRETASEGAA